MLLGLMVIILLGEFISHPLPVRAMTAILVLTSSPFFAVRELHGLGGSARITDTDQLGYKSGSESDDPQIHRSISANLCLDLWVGWYIVLSCIFVLLTHYIHYSTTTVPANRPQPQLWAV
jgi:hypothetical protein